MSRITHLSTPGQPRQVMVDGDHYVIFEAYMKLVDDLAHMRVQLQKKQRSQADHNHQFAEIKELWDTLPESLAESPYAASPEALRKHALISTGYCDTDIIDCDNHEVAMAVAPIIAKRARKAEGYAIVTVKGSLVTCSTAQSQSRKAMDKDEWRDSKEAVLNWIHGLLETHREG